MISCMIAGRGFPPLFSTLTAVASTALIALSVYIYNDICDSEMDRLNEDKYKRPVASGEVAEKDAIRFVYITGTLGLILAWMINRNVFLVSLSWLVLFVAYSNPSIRLKKMFIVKEVVTSLAWPLCSLVGSYAIADAFYLPSMFSGLLLGTFTFLGLPALSDSFDIEEDKLFGVKSLGSALSWRRRVQLLGLAVLVMMTVTPITYAQLGFNVVLPIFVVVSSLILLRFIFPIYGAFELARVMRVRKLTYLYFILVQIFVVIGSMNLPL